jgi:hypothetical protein
MDRERLKTLQQTDLTESRVNQDFLIWLKEKGVNYLLFIVLGCCAIVLYLNWQQRAASARDSAWLDLMGASTPAALSEVATKHTDVGAVSILAKLNLADKYLQSIQMGRRFDRDLTKDESKLTPEVREEWLTEADRLYREIVEEVGPTPEVFARKLFTVNALFGRAAVAESRGKFDEAKRLLEDAAAAARPEYASLQEEAQKRIDSLGWLAKLPPLPTQAELPAPPQPQQAPPALLEDLISPTADPAAEPATTEPAQPAPASETPATAPTPQPAPEEPASEPEGEGEPVVRRQVTELLF